MLPRSPVRSRKERERIVLDVAAELFYRRGVHEVGMDELVRTTGLGKATVYRLYPTKDALIGAYLTRLAEEILALIDADAARHVDEPAAAIAAIFESVARDIARPDFRGCPFNNASVEFPDPEHPARVAARRYREELHSRLADLSERVAPGAGAQLGARLALLIDGMYVNAAHLGAGGPAVAGPALARELVGATHV